MSYVRKLSVILKERNSDLYGRLSEIEKRSKSLLTYTAAAFPHFTPHDFTHGEYVVENLNWLMPDDIKPTLNDYEIFFVIVAAWLHDWGMVCKQGETPEGVRDVHHRRTEENFQHMYDKLGLNQHEASIIGRIARGHRVEDLRSDLFDPQFYSLNVRIDIRFLAAVLRLADECDITHNRVPELLYYSLNPEGASEERFKSHLSISGIGKSAPHKIEFNAIALDPRGAQTLRALRDEIQKEVDHVKGILSEHKIPIEYVDAHIYARGFIDKPISFRLDESRITQLLIGEALYSRKDVAIRELLANSVDACRLRKCSQLSYSPEIRIYKQGNRLVVQDNGIGMDYEKALNFLATKGFSYYTSDEFGKIRHQLDFDPISRWGLGILSCFLIASEILIETKKEGKDPCRFVITNVGEGWRYEQGSLKEPGTVVTLTLNDEGRKMDLEQVVRYYLKASVVPIFCGKDTTDPTKFEWTVQDDYVQRGIKWLDHEVKVEWQDKYDDEEVSVRFYKIPGILSYLFIANQGFFVEENNQLLPIPTGSIVLLNTNKELFDVDISREKIRDDTPKFHRLRNKWPEILIRFMEKGRQRTLKELGRSFINDVISYQLVMEGYELPIQLVLEFLFSELRARKISESIAPFRDFMVCRLPQLLLTAQGPTALTIEQIVSLQPRKIIMYLIATTTDIRNEIEFVEKQLKHRLKEKEIVIFLLSELLDVENYMYYDKFLKLPSGEKVQTKPYNIQRLMFELDFEKIDTGIDDLLPKGSYFSKLPKLLRGAAICKKPFIIKTPKTVSTEVAMFFVAQSILLLGKKSDRIVKPGTLVFDAEDDFNRFLIKMTDRINKAANLKNMVKNYFAELAAYFIIPSRIGEDLLTVKEGEISFVLGQTTPYNPLGKRFGSISKILVASHFAFFVPSTWWGVIIKQG